MLALGFIFGIVVGVLYFEMFSIKNPRTFEDAETLLALQPATETPLDFSDIQQEAERWK